MSQFVKVAGLVVLAVGATAGITWGEKRKVDRNVKKLMDSNNMERQFKTAAGESDLLVSVRKVLNLGDYCE